MPTEGLQQFLNEIRLEQKVPEDVMRGLVQQVGEMTARTLVTTTAVDTGHARANWQAGQDTIPTGEVDGEDKTGQATLSKIEKVIDAAPAFGLLVIANNVPYIERLDQGWSKQAPGGMSVLAEQVAIETINAEIAAGSLS